MSDQLSDDRTSDRIGTQPDADVTMPRLGATGWLRWGWRQLTSMRSALLLLLLLAVAAVPGSVLPQRPSDAARTEQFLIDHPGYGPWLDRLGFFDVYASAWFSAIYLLLFVSLVGCIVPRTRQHARALRARPPRTPRRLSHLPAHRTATVSAPPPEVLDAAGAALRRRRYRVEPHPSDGAAGSLAAERGYLAETGNLAFHVALLGLLISVGAGAALSWSGQALVVTGQSFADTLPGYDSFRSGAQVDRDRLPPFSFTLDELRVEFDRESTGNQFGAPRTFEADVTTREAPGAAPVRQKLRVNEPLTLDGVRVYLIGNGYAPVITVRDGTGAVVSSGPVPFLPRDASYTSNGVLKAPDAKPSQLGLAGFLLPTAFTGPGGMPISVFPDASNPRLIFTAWQGDLQMDSARQSPGYSVYTLDTEKLTQVRTAQGGPFRSMLAPGQSVDLPGGLGSVTFDGVRRYAALDVRYDPTKVWVLGFAGLALGGLMLSLFVRRRRVWVRAGTDGQGRTVVEVAGLARGEDEGLGHEVAALLAELAPGSTGTGGNDDRGGLAPVGARD
jgi:cytochrome c biogenesis protein